MNVSHPSRCLGSSDPYLSPGFLVLLDPICSWCLGPTWPYLPQVSWSHTTLPAVSIAHLDILTTRKTLHLASWSYLTLPQGIPSHTHLGIVRRLSTKEMMTRKATNLSDEVVTPHQKAIEDPMRPFSPPTSLLVTKSTATSVVLSHQHYPLPELLNFR